MSYESNIHKLIVFDIKKPPELGGFGILLWVAIIESLVSSLWFHNQILFS